MNKIGLSLIHRKGSSTTNTTAPLMTQRKMSNTSIERNIGQGQ